MRKRNLKDGSLADEERACLHAIQEWCGDDNSIWDLDMGEVGSAAVRPIVAGEVLRRLSGKVACNL